MKKNPFSQKSIAQKIGNKVHLPELPSIQKKKSSKEKIQQLLQHGLLYVSLFICWICTLKNPHITACG